MLPNPAPLPARRAGRRPAARALVGTVAVAAALLAACGVEGDAAASTTTAATSDAPPTTVAGADPTTPTTPDTTVVEEGRGDVPADDPPPEEHAGVPSSMVPITDPVNNAFSAQVPEGWESLAYSTVEGQVTRLVVNTVSPDGGTVLFVGDPKIPSYWEPEAANEMVVRFADMLDSMELRSYTPAEQYVVEYVNEKFGEIDDFQLGELSRAYDREENLMNQAASQGVALNDVQVATQRFSFTDGEGRPNQAGVTIGTMSASGTWTVEISGATTTGDLDPFLAKADEIAGSRQMNPDFQAQQQQRHNDTMAMIDQRTREMTERHEANMAWIQDSANAHQQRMQGIWASNDAQMASYYDRMASGDVEHRQFLNYINDERTVQNSAGVKSQVDDGYQRYWQHTSGSGYLGGDANFDESAISSLGENPSNYEEVQIVKG